MAYKQKGWESGNGEKPKAGRTSNLLRKLNQYDTKMRQDVGTTEEDVADDAMYYPKAGDKGMVEHAPNKYEAKDGTTYHIYDDADEGAVKYPDGTSQTFGKKDVLEQIKQSGAKQTHWR